MLSKLIVLLSAFSVIKSPFPHRPYVNNPEEVQSNNPGTLQEVLRKEYDQWRYTSDPSKTFNQHASLQAPPFHHSYDAPIHVHTSTSVNPHLIRNSISETMHSIHHHIPQHQSYTHRRPILSRTANELPSPFHHHLFSPMEQKPKKMIHHPLSQNNFFSNPQPVMEHSQRQVHTSASVNPHLIRNSIPETVHSIHQHIPQDQSNTNRRPILSRTANEFRSPIPHHSFSPLEQTPNDMIHRPLPQDNFFAKQQPVMKDSNKQVSQPIQHHQLGHISVAKLPIHQKVDIEPTSIDTVKRDIHDISSVEIRSKSGITVYDVPEYDKTLENLYEIAHSARIVADNPKATIQLKNTMKMTDMLIYVCILNRAKIRHFFPPTTSYFCCERYLKIVLIEKKVYNKICNKYGEIICQIPEEEKRNLRSIYPSKSVPKVINWVLERRII